MQPQIDRLMEVLIMKRFWRKQLPAALLALVLMISLVPAVGAVEGDGSDVSTDPPPSEVHKHSFPDTWTQNGDAGHIRKCATCETTESQPHTFGEWRESTPASC